MLLIDSISSFAVEAAGRSTGVSVDMSVTVLATVEAGTRINVEAKALRIGRTVAFLSIELRRAEGDELVAVGAHTKHLGLPTLARAKHAFGLRFLPFARWQLRQGLEWWSASRKQLKIGQLSAASMEEALGVKFTEADGPSDQFKAFVMPHLLNANFAGHGAASAGLLAEAVRQHLSGRGISGSIVELSMSYLNPVPKLSEVLLVITPLAAATGSSTGVRHFTAELTNPDGEVLVRGRVTVVAAGAGVTLAAAAAVAFVVYRLRRRKEAARGLAASASATGASAVTAPPPATDAAAPQKAAAAPLPRPQAAAPTAAPAAAQRGGLEAQRAAALGAGQYAAPDLEVPLEEDLRKRLTARYSPSYLDIENQGNSCGKCKVAIVMVSAAFEGQSKLKRQMEFRAFLNADMEDHGGRIHALSQRLCTPEEYKKLLERQPQS